MFRMLPNRSVGGLFQMNWLKADSFPNYRGTRSSCLVKGDGAFLDKLESNAGHCRVTDMVLIY